MHGRLQMKRRKSSKGRVVDEIFGSIQIGEVDKTILGKGTGDQNQSPITLGQGPVPITNQPTKRKDA